ncbi:hypothetical protein KUH32_17990, partial [Thalassococcus sp. CAU 1522]
MTTETMQNPGVFAPSSEVVTRAHVDAAKYDALYAASVSDPEGFWGEQAGRVDWIKAPTR